MATTFVQTDFRFRNDDGSETSATWLAAATTNYTYTLHTTDSGALRVRIAVEQTGTTSATFTGHLYISKNSGAYTAASASSTTGIKVVSSTNFTDNDATTQQLTAGTFVAGKMDDVDGTCTATATMAQTRFTEHEYMLQIDYPNVSNGDTFSFEERNNTTALTTYTNVGTITVTKVSGTFPTTSILDNFTRTDNPLTLGVNWTLDTNTSWGDILGISSNHAYNATASNGGINYWSASSFSGTLESFTTISMLSGGHDIDGVIFSNGLLSGSTGYLIGAIAPDNEVIVYSDFQGSFTSILTISQTVTAADSVGGTLTANGVLTVWYKVGAGSWNVIGVVKNTTYSCSYIGIELASDGTGRLSSFGGGTYVAPSTGITFRKTLSGIGTGAGKRQIMGWGQ